MTPRPAKAPKAAAPRPGAAGAGAAPRPGAAGAGTAPKLRKAPDKAVALAIACARAADEKLGEGTQILDVRGRTAVCDFIILTTADSQPHLRAVADAMQEAAAVAGSRLHHREGDPGSPWVLLDFVDVVAHIFDGPSRKFYDLERLWADARRLPWKAAEPAKRTVRKKG